MKTSVTFSPIRQSANFPPKDDGQQSQALQFRLIDCAHKLELAINAPII